MGGFFDLIQTCQNPKSILHYNYMVKKTTKTESVNLTEDQIQELWESARQNTDEFINQESFWNGILKDNCTASMRNQATKSLELIQNKEILIAIIFERLKNKQEIKPKGLLKDFEIIKEAKKLLNQLCPITIEESDQNQAAEEKLEPVESGLQPNQQSPSFGTGAGVDGGIEQIPQLARIQALEQILKDLGQFDSEGNPLYTPLRGRDLGVNHFREVSHGFYFLGEPYSSFVIIDSLCNDNAGYILNLNNAPQYAGMTQKEIFRTLNLLDKDQIEVVVGITRFEHNIGWESKILEIVRGLITVPTAVNDRGFGEMGSEVVESVIGIELVSIRLQKQIRHYNALKTYIEDNNYTKLVPVLGVDISGIEFVKLKNLQNGLISSVIKYKNLKTYLDIQEKDTFDNFVEGLQEIRKQKIQAQIQEFNALKKHIELYQELPTDNKDGSARFDGVKVRQICRLANGIYDPKLKIKVSFIKYIRNERLDDYNFIANSLTIIFEKRIGHEYSNEEKIKLAAKYIAIVKQTGARFSQSMVGTKEYYVYNMIQNAVSRNYNLFLLEKFPELIELWENSKKTERKRDIL
jgi:hypothetical protein